MSKAQKRATVPSGAVPMRAHMAIWALRYALGRSSYVVGLVADEVGRLLPSLPTGDLRTIERDVGETLYETGHGALAPCDATTWTRLRMQVRNEIEKRGDK